MSYDFNYTRYSREGKLVVAPTFFYAVVVVVVVVMMYALANGCLPSSQQAIFFKNCATDARLIHARARSSCAPVVNPISVLLHQVLT